MAAPERSPPVEVSVWLVIIVGAAGLTGACSKGSESKTTGDAGAVCVAGATQTCLGPGACQGAQSCLPNGASWSPCDCGTNKGGGGAAGGRGGGGGRGAGRAGGGGGGGGRGAAGNGGAGGGAGGVAGGGAGRGGGDGDAGGASGGMGGRGETS